MGTMRNLDQRGVVYKMNYYTTINDFLLEKLKVLPFVLANVYSCTYKTAYDIWENVTFLLFLPLEKGLT